MASRESFLVSEGSDDDDNLCPICFDKMSETDFRLFPCPCNYQICIWCLDTLVKDNKPCPNCRAPYNKENYRIIEEESSEGSEDEYYDYDDSYSEEEEPDWKKKRQYSEYNKKKESDHDRLAEIPQRAISPEIMQMRTTRIIQRNLVYLVGLPAENMTEEFLRSESMFGQYGNLLKVVKSRNDSSLGQSQSIVLYLTFEKEEEARTCIVAIDGHYYKGSILKASYGTTKYCNSFIYGKPCTNKNCLYLHTQAPPEDCFSREHMTSSDEHFYKLTHPGNGSVWDPVHHNFVYRRRPYSRNANTNNYNYNNTRYNNHYNHQYRSNTTRYEEDEYEDEENEENDSLPPPQRTILPTSTTPTPTPTPTPTSPVPASVPASVPTPVPTPIPARVRPSLQLCPIGWKRDEVKSDIKIHFGFPQDGREYVRKDQNLGGQPWKRGSGLSGSASGAFSFIDMTKVSFGFPDIQMTSTSSSAGHPIGREVDLNDLFGNASWK